MTLSCPRCGLVLALRGPQVEYCPRCIARRRQPVPLIAKALIRGGPRGREPRKGADGSDPRLRRPDVPG
jgi:hypothetical protein